jgi:HEAT repeats
MQQAQGPDRYVAPQAMIALGEIGPAACDAIPLLLQLASTETESGMYTAEALGLIASPDDPAVISALEKAAASRNGRIATSGEQGLRDLRRRRRTTQPAFPEGRE